MIFQYFLVAVERERKKEKEKEKEKEDLRCIIRG